ncbi:hypothetical protein [Demequina aurantiaca]|uniref:hypothetical protein n=1 Tax=Demequina aurantiaca TaxID=676200 RepID=UPI000784F71A|nr:hypothetical protein [Demequina aurantiaca]
MIPTTRATITASAAAVIAATGYLGTKYLAGGILLCVLALAWGWPHLAHVSRTMVSSLVIAGGGALAIFAVALGRSEPYLRYMVIAVAAVTIAALASEIFFASQRGHAVTSVAGTAAGGAIATSGAAWLAANRTVGAEDLVVAGGTVLAVAAVAAVLTSNGNVNAVLTIVLGTGAGSGMGQLLPSMSWWGGALVGLSCAVTVVLTNELYRREPRPRTHMAGIASGITPVLVAGMLVYLGGRLLVG